MTAMSSIPTTYRTDWDSRSTVLNAKDVARVRTCLPNVTSPLLDAVDGQRNEGRWGPASC